MLRHVTLLLYPSRHQLSPRRTLISKLEGFNSSEENVEGVRWRDGYGLAPIVFDAQILSH